MFERISAYWGRSIVNHLPRQSVQVIFDLNRVILILQGCFWRPSDNTLQSKHSIDISKVTLDGRNRAIVIAESLARVIAAIRITSVHWQSYLPLKHRIWSS